MFRSKKHTSEDLVVTFTQSMLAEPASPLRENLTLFHSKSAPSSSKENDSHCNSSSLQQQPVDSRRKLVASAAAVSSRGAQWPGRGVDPYSEDPSGGIVIKHFYAATNSIFMWQGVVSSLLLCFSCFVEAVVNGVIIAIVVVRGTIPIHRSTVSPSSLLLLSCRCYWQIPTRLPPAG